MIQLSGVPLTTQYAVGPAWANATPAQRDALFTQFQTLLARTYALQLTQLRGQDTTFRYAPPAPLAPNATDALVKTSVVTGGEVMPIDYRLRKTGAGEVTDPINLDTKFDFHDEYRMASSPLRMHPCLGWHHRAAWWPEPGSRPGAGRTRR